MKALDLAIAGAFIICIGGGLTILFQAMSMLAGWYVVLVVCVLLSGAVISTIGFRQERKLMQKRNEYFRELWRGDRKDMQDK